MKKLVCWLKAVYLKLRNQKKEGPMGMGEQELKDIITKHGKYLRNEPGGECANLSRADLSSANLGGANLSGADLSYADLRYANLGGADLSYANLSYANLSSAYLCGADLSRADLRYANLSSANLSYADLRGADLRYANLRYANLSGADLSGANLSYADLSYADLSGANLSYADLRGANLSGANLQDTIAANKPLATFMLGRHIAAINLDGTIGIGCHKHTPDEWLAQFKTIGQQNNYTTAQINAYGAFIKFAKWAIDSSNEVVEPTSTTDVNNKEGI